VNIRHGKQKHANGPNFTRISVIQSTLFIDLVEVNIRLWYKDQPVNAV